MGSNSYLFESGSIRLSVSISLISNPNMWTDKASGLPKLTSYPQCLTRSIPAPSVTNGYEENLDTQFYFGACRETRLRELASLLPPRLASTMGNVHKHVWLEEWLHSEETKLNEAIASCERIRSGWLAESEIEELRSRHKDISNHEFTEKCEDMIVAIPSRLGSVRELLHKKSK